MKFEEELVELKNGKKIRRISWENKEKNLGILPTMMPSDDGMSAILKKALVASFFLDTKKHNEFVKNKDNQDFLNKDHINLVKIDLLADDWEILSI